MCGYNKDGRCFSHEAMRRELGILTKLGKSIGIQKPDNCETTCEFKIETKFKDNSQSHILDRDTREERQLGIF